MSRHVTLHMNGASCEAVRRGGFAIVMSDQIEALGLPGKNHRVRVTATQRGRYELLRGTQTGGIAMVLSHYNVYDHKTKKSPTWVCSRGLRRVLYPLPVRIGARFDFVVSR